MLAAQDIAKVLEARGWIAKVLHQSDLEREPLKVTKRGLFKCVDGRPSDNKNMNGPKTLGGVYALVASREKVSLRALENAVKEVKAAGFEPSVHGDCKHDEMGCGFFKLWRTGRLDGLSRPNYTAGQGRVAVELAKGKYETLEGTHSESCVIINLVENFTYAPHPDQSFVVDAWVTERFKGIDQGKYLTLAAETVEKLGGPMVAKIIVADPEE